MAAHSFHIIIGDPHHIGPHFGGMLAGSVVVIREFREVCNRIRTNVFPQ
jgi:hypothetical protein